jgi:hypothetical protein
VITDSAPANTTYQSSTGGAALSSGNLTWTIANVAAGATGSVTMTVKVNNVSICSAGSTDAHHHDDGDDDDNDHRYGRRGHYRGDHCDHDDDDAACVSTITNSASIKAASMAMKSSNTVTTALARPNRPPVVNTSDRTDNKGASVSVQITGSDPDGDSITFSATGLPGGLSMSTSGKITGTLTTAGTFNVTITVKDPQNATGTDTFVWTVKNSNRAPSVATSDRTDNKGTALTVQITGSDPDGDTVTYSASNLPPGLSMNSAGKITGTPSTTGTFTVTVTVKDPSNATGSDTFVWKIVQPNRPPVSADDSVSTIKGTAKTFAVLGNDDDPDDDTLQITSFTQPPASKGTVTKNSNKRSRSRRRTTRRAP